MLEAHPDFRVIRRLPEFPDFTDRQPGDIALPGIVLDIETTGVLHGTDAIIELGMVKFDYSPLTGEVYGLSGIFNGFEDPGIPIPASATKISGITDEMVAGTALDGEAIRDFCDGASFIVAHNADFDRKFMEKRFALFSEIPWCCSMSEIAWGEEGILGTKLDYIAYRMGFFYESHRAFRDCMATLEILKRPLPVTGKPGLNQLLEKIDRTSYRVWALNTPFETKDALSARGYKWWATLGINDAPPAWSMVVNSDSELQAELQFLRQAVYGQGRFAQVQIDEIRANNRFSARRGQATRKLMLPQ